MIPRRSSVRMCNNVRAIASNDLLGNRIAVRGTRRTSIFSFVLRLLAMRSRYRNIHKGLFVFS